MKTIVIKVTSSLSNVLTDALKIAGLTINDITFMHSTHTERSPKSMNEFFNGLSDYTVTFGVK
jgi:hypothetical protein